MNRDEYYAGLSYTRDYIKHHGIEGQKWGVRRFQNPDGSLTEDGKVRYGRAVDTLHQVKTQGEENRKAMRTSARSTEKKAAALGGIYGGLYGFGVGTLAGGPGMGAILGLAGAAGGAAGGSLGAAINSFPSRMINNIQTKKAEKLINKYSDVNLSDGEFKTLVTKADKLKANNDANRAFYETVARGLFGFSPIGVGLNLGIRDASEYNSIASDSAREYANTKKELKN